MSFETNGHTVAKTETHIMHGRPMNPRVVTAIMEQAGTQLNGGFGSDYDFETEDPVAGISYAGEEPTRVEQRQKIDYPNWPA